MAIPTDIDAFVVRLGVLQTTAFVHCTRKKILESEDQN